MDEMDLNGSRIFMGGNNWDTHRVRPVFHRALNCVPGPTKGLVSSTTDRGQGRGRRHLTGDFWRGRGVNAADGPYRIAWT